VIKERLIQFDPEARLLSYEAAAGMPWFIHRRGQPLVGYTPAEAAPACQQGNPSRRTMTVPELV
jgi:hypothetical protein